MSSDVALRSHLAENLFSCYPFGVQTFQAVHVVGNSVHGNDSCGLQHASTPPTLINTSDYDPELLRVTLDTEALKQFLAARRPLAPPPDPPALSTTSSTFAAAPLSRATSLPPYHFQSSAAPSSTPRRSQPAAQYPSHEDNLVRAVHTWTPVPQPLTRNQSDSELAATGRRGGGASPSSTHLESSHHLAFSKLMQTDDVSSIAEQIASQAELIYQTWKSTGLNPNQLIRYHSIVTEPDEVDSGSGRSVTPVPRTPVRSISPAPPGSSPAVPRRLLDQSTTNGRQQQHQQVFPGKPFQPHYSHQQQQQYQQQLRESQYSPQYNQQQYHNQQQQYQNQHVQQVQNQSQHASSPVRTLNASPRPYVSPSTSSPLRSGSPSPGVGSSGFQYPSSPRPFVSSPPPFVSSPPLSPPQPPERSSSYTGNEQQGENLQILSDPKLEVSLRDLVNTFVLEDKARQGIGSRINERPKSAPSSIQDALQRFERQMAITSRATPPLTDERIQSSMPSSVPSQYPPNVYSSSYSSSSSSTSYAPSNPGVTRFSQNSVGTTSSNAAAPKRYLGTRSDSSVTDAWPKSNNPELDFRSRRSVSPSPPPLAQPGWNETSQSSTSTWPLKLKQPTSPSAQLPAASYSPTSVSVSPPKTSPVSPPASSYVTTLEARVEGPGSTIPMRHKVINLGPPTQEERILQTLRSSSLIQESEQKRLIGQQQQQVLVRPGNVVSSSVSSSHITTVSNTARQKPKFSISVTVDVDSSTNVLDNDVPVNRIRPSSGDEVSQLSAIDYAKVRFQEAQQHPKTAVRLQDERSLAPRSGTINGDGRVLSVKSRFEPGEGVWRPFDPVLSTLPEFYRRKLRKMQRKAGSPEPLAGVLATLPHPELTDQQKAHIRERSQSPTAAAFHAAAGAAAIRPFLTQGSVAERVMIFERAPVEMKPKPPSEIAHITQERRRPVLPYRDPDTVRSKAQASEEPLGSPPLSGSTSPAIAAAVSTVSRHLESAVPALPAPADARQTYVRDPNLQDKPQNVLAASSSNSVGAAAASTSGSILHNKENTRPGVVSPVLPSSSSVPTQPKSPLSSPAFPAASGTSGSTTTPAGAASPSSPTHLAGAAGRTAPAGPAAPPPVRRLTKASSKNIVIPKFYFPQGRPGPSGSQETSLQRVAACFREHSGQITKDQLPLLMRACNVPLYWKAPVFVAAGGDKLGYLTQELFADYWTRVLSTCHDEASRFIHVLSRGTRNFALPEDFIGLIQDVVDSHPGLAFLKDAAEFHSRYVHTVVARIYYCVNRSWSGRITAAELRRSNLLSVISYLEDEEDINQITEYFSYEHFYVIYCKFWELDTDHDLFIDKHDLAKHNERALSWHIIERIFSGAVTRGRAQKQDRMGYQEFVWFLISEEDKRHPTAIEYWFRCMDIDGDGFLSMYELEYFYEEQLQRMEALGIETLPFYDCLCQMLDMVRPEVPNKISLTDLKRCRMTPIFFDTFFNLEKYLDHEQRDPFASHRAEDDGPEVSDWDRYAAEEYELLVAEEGGADPQDDMVYGDEDELSAGLEAVLAGGGEGGSEAGAATKAGGALSKHSSLSTTLTNLAVDAMDVDDDYPDYADSDDYHY